MIQNIKHEGITTRKAEINVLSATNPATGLRAAKSMAEPPPTERPKTITGYYK